MSDLINLAKQRSALRATVPAGEYPSRSVAAELDRLFLAMGAASDGHLWNMSTGEVLPVEEIGRATHFWEMEGQPSLRGEFVTASKVADWYIGHDYVAVDDVETPTVARAAHGGMEWSSARHFHVLRR